MRSSICFVAAPLIARSGVYHSTIELVTAGRAAGLEWTAVIGASRNAAGSRATIEGVREFEAEPTGPMGVASLARRIRAFPEARDADLLVSMVPQSDMALSIGSAHWVAYLRGRPWPARGEASALKIALWRTLEKLALSRASEVWATTSVLAAEVGGAVDRLVAPGLRPPTPPAVTGGRDDFVWAARYSIDKNPRLFFEAMRDSPAQGVMYGTGPLEEELRASAPDNVQVAGWRSRDEIWRTARAYVGTSTREAFGRSAVEAAMLGIPVVISREFGCADMLFTDPLLAARFVLPVEEPEAWAAAVQALSEDGSLHAEAAAHLAENASRLTLASAVKNVREAAVQIVKS